MTFFMVYKYDIYCSNAKTSVNSCDSQTKINIQFNFIENNLMFCTQKYLHRKWTQLTAKTLQIILIFSQKNL